MPFGVILPDEWGSWGSHIQQSLSEGAFSAFLPSFVRTDQPSKASEKAQAKMYRYKQLQISWRIAKWSCPINVGRVHKLNFPFIKSCKSFLFYLGKSPSSCGLLDDLRVLLSAKITNSRSFLMQIFYSGSLSKPSSEVLLIQDSALLTLCQWRKSYPL